MFLHCDPQLNLEVLVNLLSLSLKRLHVMQNVIIGTTYQKLVTYFNQDGEGQCCVTDDPICNVLLRFYVDTP